MQEGLLPQDLQECSWRRPKKKKDRVFCLELALFLHVGLSVWAATKSNPASTSLLLETQREKKIKTKDKIGFGQKKSVSPLLNTMWILCMMLIEVGWVCNLTTHQPTYFSYSRGAAARMSCPLSKASSFPLTLKGREPWCKKTARLHRQKKKKVGHTLSDHHSACFPHSHTHIPK